MLGPRDYVEAETEVIVNQVRKEMRVIREITVARLAISIVGWAVLLSLIAFFIFRP